MAEFWAPYVAGLALLIAIGGVAMSWRARRFARTLAHLTHLEPESLVAIGAVLWAAQRVAANGDMATARHVASLRDTLKLLPDSVWARTATIRWFDGERDLSHDRNSSGDMEGTL